MMQAAPGLATDARWTRANVRTPFEQCRGCKFSGSGFCRIILDEPLFGTYPPVLRRFGRGKRIVEHDDTSSFLGVIRSGFARRSVMQMSGKRILMDLAMPGDIIGALPRREHVYDFEVATDIEICSYDSATVKRQMETNQRFRRLILQEVDHQHHRLLGLLWQNGMLNSRERIMAFLVNAVEFMPTEPLPGGSLVLRMEIHRGDWADLTNTTVETISRTMRYLEEKGLVNSLTPYRFRIRDLDLLATIAGVEPPARRVGGSDRSNRMETRFGSPKSDGRMTAVNESARRVNRLDAVMKPVSVKKRGLARRRSEDVQEEIRD